MITNFARMSLQRIIKLQAISPTNDIQTVILGLIEWVEQPQLHLQQIANHNLRCQQRDYTDRKKSGAFMSFHR
jgi:hypothetical protein